MLVEQRQREERGDAGGLRGVAGNDGVDGKLTRVQNCEREAGSRGRTETAGGELEDGSGEGLLQKHVF